MKPTRPLAHSLHQARAVDSVATRSEMEASIAALRSRLAAIDEKLRQLIPGVDVEAVAKVFSYRAEIATDLSETEAAMEKIDRAYRRK